MVFRGFVPSSSSIVARVGCARLMDRSEAPGIAAAAWNSPADAEPLGVSGQDDRIERNIAIQKLENILYPIIKMWNQILSGFPPSVTLMTCASSSHWARFPANCAGCVIFSPRAVDTNADSRRFIKPRKAAPKSPPDLVGHHFFQYGGGCRSLFVVSSNPIGRSSELLKLPENLIKERLQKWRRGDILC